MLDILVGIILLIISLSISIVLSLACVEAKKMCDYIDEHDDDDDYIELEEKKK